MNYIEKVKDAMKKDFNVLYQKEFTTDWEAQRFVRGLQIDVMGVDNLATLLQESNEEAVREFIDWVMGVKAGENLGMGSLDYHEKLVINGFKEYIKFHFIEGSYLSSRGDKGEQR